MIKAEDIKVTEDEVIVEETVDCEKVGFLDKVKTGLKKHGKKVAIAAAIGTVGTVGLIGYALVKKSPDVSNVLDDVVTDVDFTEVTDDITE